MIPDFQTIFLPILEFLRDKQTRNTKDIRNAIVRCFNVTDVEQSERTPSGKQFLFYNRVAWAISYLKMADLINSPTRSQYAITALGQKFLSEGFKRLTVGDLKKLPGFQKNRGAEKQEVAETPFEISEKTPDEIMEIGYNQILTDLSAKLLFQVRQVNAFYFEKLVVDLLIKMGYGGSDIDNGEVTRKSSDEGIDGIIREDKLGLDKIYVQAKKWSDSVERPEVQKFVGALQGKRAKKGVFITTSTFSKGAIEYAKHLDVSVVLIDGKQLADLMIENELGVSIKRIYKIAKIDSDYFEEEEIE